VIERTFFHYTCRHGAVGIRGTGWVRPSAHPLLCHELLWLTDMAQPQRAALGLSAHTPNCDRTSHRVTVTTSTAVWWPIWARRLDLDTRRKIDAVYGALPASWWVNPGQLRALKVEKLSELVCQ
jgi:hypothetical protein